MSHQPLGPAYQSALEKIHEAIRNQKIKKIRRYITRYADVIVKLCTAPGPDGYSAVTSAADFGYVEIMTLLVTSEVPVHWSDANGWLTLHCAARQGHEQMIEYLISTHMDLDLRNRAGWTALQVAITKGHVKVVRLLVQAYADVNAQGPLGWTACHLVAHAGNLDLLEALADTPPKMKLQVTMRNDNGATPMYVAAQAGHVPLVQRFAERYSYTS